MSSHRTPIPALTFPSDPGQQFEERSERSGVGGRVFEQSCVFGSRQTDEDIRRKPISCRGRFEATSDAVGGCRGSLRWAPWWSELRQTLMPSEFSYHYGFR